MGRSSQISVVVLFCSSPACPNLSFNQPRPQALMRYRVTEGGLEPNAIARGVLGEFSRRARWVTSQLIFRRGRLGTRLSFNRNKICNFRLQKRRCHRKDTLCASGDEPLSRRVFLSLLGGIPVVQESQVSILVLLIYPFDNFYSCFWLAISLPPIRGGGHMLKTIFIHKLLVFIADKLRTI